MIWKVDNRDIPSYISHIRNAPAQLYAAANTPDTLCALMRRPRIAIVGTRRVTPYGRQAARVLASELAARGVVIVSGLALGVDSIAHRSALEANGMTVAVLPGSVEEIYPASHASLAASIVQSGGALLSEYPKGTPTFPNNFVARNRIIAGLADALLIVEAAERSGALHTVHFAEEQGVPVLAVPGNITSATSAGTNNLIKKGHTAVTSAADVLAVLNINIAQELSDKKLRHTGDNPQEQLLLDLLERGISDGSDLLRQSQLTIETFNHHMTMLEITAKIQAFGANQWGLA